MKITAVTMMMLLSGALAYCGSETTTGENRVTVCLSSGTVAGIIVKRAKILAAAMFNEIGVAINWQQRSRKCPSDAIAVKLIEETPSSLKPGAFASALPYEGVHIQVFYDRISYAFDGSMIETVLTNVLVHEITHILEGISRHSEQGVMKAKWSRTDYFQMAKGMLRLAPEDVDLIHLGLAARRQLAMFTVKQTRAGQPRAVN